jgi:hypothetical protein
MQTIPMITQEQEHVGQYATKPRALAAAKAETMRFLSRPKHTVSLVKTWRNLEERMCWYVSLDTARRKY